MKLQNGLMRTKFILLQQEKKFHYTYFHLFSLNNLGMKYWLGLILIFCCNLLIVSQENQKSKNKKVGAMVAYYFWEVKTDSTILNAKINQPYKRNHEVELKSKKQSESLYLFDAQYAVLSLIEKTNNKKCGKHFEYNIDSTKVKKYKFPIKSTKYTELSSVAYYKKNNKWSSTIEKAVLYFNHYSDSSIQFIKSSDTIQLVAFDNKILAENHYTIHSYLNQNSEVVKQEIFNYAKENVTKSFLVEGKSNPRRFVVFSNGYRGPNKNNDNTDNIVTNNDRFGYWLGIDKAFKKRLEPDESFYIDGNQTIRTSGHKSMVNFGISIAAVKTFSKKDFYKILNSKPNVQGFNERREQGKIAGKAFLIAKCNSLDCNKTLDTVDIVCHSMGYSYALGFIDELKGKVIFGKMYIIAPESACVGGADWSMFEEVWQYGTNLDQPNADPVWQQDGIAPQSQVFGLEKVPSDKGGRVFFPDYWPIKNFIDSHMLYNYMWIFDNILKGQKGYICK